MPKSKALAMVSKFIKNMKFLESRVGLPHMFNFQRILELQSIYVLLIRTQLRRSWGQFPFTPKPTLN